MKISSVQKYNLKIVISSIVWFVAFAMFLICLPAVKAWSWWLVLGLLVFALVLTGLIVAVVKFGFKRKLGLYFYPKLSLFIFLIAVTMIGFPVYYFSYITVARPVLVPQATLSNGSKTVIFQGMMHIGREEFYKSVIYDLENALSTGYRIFYEGVAPGTPESDKWFSDYVTDGKDLSKAYKTMANLCGLKYQIDYFGFLVTDMKKHPQSHVNADVNTAQMKAEYDRLMLSDAEFAQSVKDHKKTTDSDDNSSFISEIIANEDAISYERRTVIGALCRGFMTLKLTSPAAEESQQSKVILDYRNRNLADKILQEKAQKIYITYGSEHFKGVLSLLKENDPQWEIKSIKWNRVLGAAEEYKGLLN